MIAFPVILLSALVWLMWDMSPALALGSLTVALGLLLWIAAVELHDILKRKP